MTTSANDSSNEKDETYLVDLILLVARSSRQASLEEVRTATGYAASGTPPFGHTTPVRVFADHSLKRNNPVWAAGGTPSTVFPISLADLDRLAKPTWGDITVS